MFTFRDMYELYSKVSCRVTWVVFIYCLLRWICCNFFATNVCILMSSYRHNLLWICLSFILCAWHVFLLVPGKFWKELLETFEYLCFICQISNICECDQLQFLMSVLNFYVLYIPPIV